MKKIPLLILSFLFLLPTAFAQDGKPFALPETDEGLPGEGVIRRYDWFQHGDGNRYRCD